MNTDDMDQSHTMSEARDIPTDNSQHKRQYVRSTVEAVRHSASSLTSTMKSSSAVFKFGIETMEKLMSPARSYTVQTWQSYGDPLLSHLDDKLDRMVDAIQTAANENESKQQQQQQQNAEQQASYAFYFTTLREKLTKSTWFARVDSILLQNSFVSTVTSKVVRPAELFFNTATEVFITNNDNFDSFLAGMKERMGPTWDDRLTVYSKAFFQASQTCKKFVGAGKFFGGAFQLTRRHLNNAIDDLLEKWDRVLGSADTAVDTWLPDVDKHAPTGMDFETEEFGMEGDEELEDEEDLMFEMDIDTADAAQEAEGEEPVVEDENKVLATEHLTLDHELEPQSRRHEFSPIARKVALRLRQRIPYMKDMPKQVKESLMRTMWFKRVDEILEQNSIVQLMQTQMAFAVSTVVRPAEHFYNTAVESFHVANSSRDHFMQTLRSKMGKAWDDRLTSFADSFFKSAERDLAQSEEAVKAEAAKSNALE